MCHDLKANVSWPPSQYVQKRECVMHTLSFPGNPKLRWWEWGWWNSSASCPPRTPFITHLPTSFCLPYWRSTKKWYSCPLATSSSTPWHTARRTDSCSLQWCWSHLFLRYPCYIQALCKLYSVVDPGISELGVRSQRGRILGVWGLFRCPFTYTLCFCSESNE